MGGEAFKALADPTRRHILELLRTKDLTAGEIAEHFDMTKPSLSHHLNTLKTAGLVEAERDGQNIIYSLNIFLVLSKTTGRKVLLQMFYLN